MLKKKKTIAFLHPEFRLLKLWAKMVLREVKDGDKGTEKEYFVHVSGLIDEIKDDDDVTFQAQQLLLLLSSGCRGRKKRRKWVELGVEI